MNMSVLTKVLNFMSFLLPTYGLIIITAGILFFSNILYLDLGHADVVRVVLKTPEEGRAVAYVTGLFGLPYFDSPQGARTIPGFAQT
jgi:hypothetical protein